MVTRPQMNNKEEIPTILKRKQSKIHRLEQHIGFLTTCRNLNSPPKYTEINPKFLTLVNWSRSEIRSKRIERVKNDIKKLKQICITLNMISIYILMNIIITYLLYS